MNHRDAYWSIKSAYESRDLVNWFRNNPKWVELFPELKRAVDFLALAERLVHHEIESMMEPDYDE